MPDDHASDDSCADDDENPSSGARSAYRAGLVSTQESLTASYDKLVISLAGGALALSMTFVRDFAGTGDTRCSWMLLSAWTLFAASLGAILLEIFMGIAAYKFAIQQCDADSKTTGQVGGKSATRSLWFQRAAVLSLLSGLLLLLVFVFINLEVNHV